LTNLGGFQMEVSDNLFLRLLTSSSKTAEGVVNASLSEFGLEYKSVAYQDGLKLAGNILNLNK